MTPVFGSWRSMVIKLFLLSLSVSFFISLCSASDGTDQHIRQAEKFLWRPWLHHGIKTDVVVAQDGSGKYTSIQQAIDAVPKHRREGHRFVIHVKAGVYNETVRMGRDMHNLTLVGDGIGKTIITSDRVVHPATVQVFGHGFFGQGITFRNTAGPQNKKRAMALQSSTDKGVFYLCSFEGHHKTLFVQSMRTFFRECTIYGTSDIIFGSAAAVFQKSKIFVRKGVSRHNSITLHRRDHSVAYGGFSLIDSTVMPAPDLLPFVHQYNTYLGQPVGKYATTVFMRSYLHGFIHPKGWYLPHDSNSIVYYGEYENHGAGARTAGRVKWPGYHVMNRAEASQFTVEGFLKGQLWLPATTVPFDLGL